MKKLLLWVGENFPALLAFGFALWAIADHKYDVAQFFLLMAVLAGIGLQVGEILRRVKRLEDDDR